MTGEPSENDGAKRLRRKAYAQELLRLQIELVKLQQWVVHASAKIVVVFEGRDAAGKGGIIRRITERTNPRVFRVVALPAPTEREKTQLFAQRYIERFPAAGELVIFDRSWYNRAGVEHVMGFVDAKDYERFLGLVPKFEKALIDGGIQLIKYWLEVGEKEQTRRIQDRIDNPLKVWKLSPLDLESHHRWYDYSRARDAMFRATDTEGCPWHVVRSDDKRRARLSCINHLLSQIDYKEVPNEKVSLPGRQDPSGYVEPAYPWRFIPEKY